jgi:hypothetical protein
MELAAVTQERPLWFRRLVTRRTAQKIQQAADGTAIACFFTVGESSIADKARRVQHPAGVRRAAFDENRSSRALAPWGR